jgi:hypothetical protein
MLLVCEPLVLFVNRSVLLLCAALARADFLLQLLKDSPKQKALGLKFSPLDLSK